MTLHVSDDDSGHRVRLFYIPTTDITLRKGDTLTVEMSEREANQLLLEFLSAIAKVQKAR